MLREICAGDRIVFFEHYNIKRFVDRIGYRTVAVNYRLVWAEVVKATKSRLISLGLLRNDGPGYVPKNFRRSASKLFLAFADLRLKSTGARGRLLACAADSTHSDAQKHLDLAAAIASKRNPIRRFSIYEDEMARRIHETRHKKRNESGWN